MIVSLVILVVCCVAVRFVVIRYTRHGAIANFATAAVAAAFVFGSLAHPFGSAPVEVPQPDASATVVAPAASGSVADAGQDDLSDISARCAGLAKPTATNGAGSIDFIATDAAATTGQASGARIDRDHASVLIGWASSSDHKTLASAACLFVDGIQKSGVVERYGAARPDVAKAFASSALGKSGFKMSIPADALSPGPHELSVAVVSSDRSTAILATPSFRVDVK